MAGIESGLYELGRLDQLARLDTAVHRLDPRAKVITTMVFLVCVVSFGKYDLLGLLPFAVFPVVMASEGDIPFSYLGSRLLAAAPFAVVVGMFNPLLDRVPVAELGGIVIAAGWISFASIVVRFLLTTAAALALIATTGMNRVCLALERLGVPDVFSTQLLFLYRYIFVLGDEASRMIRARSLRSFGTRGTGLAVFGQILGHLLLRTYARASRVYDAMLCRGFDGRIRTTLQLRFTRGDAAFVVGWSAVFVLFRLYNIPLLVGRVVTGLVG